MEQTISQLVWERIEAGEARGALDHNIDITDCHSRSALNQTGDDVLDHARSALQNFFYSYWGEVKIFQLDDIVDSPEKEWGGMPMLNVISKPCEYAITFHNDTLVSQEYLSITLQLVVENLVNCITSWLWRYFILGGHTDDINKGLLYQPDIESQQIVTVPFRSRNGAPTLKDIENLSNQAMDLVGEEEPALIVNNNLCGKLLGNHQDKVKWGTHPTPPRLNDIPLYANSFIPKYGKNTICAIFAKLSAAYTILYTKSMSLRIEWLPIDTYTVEVSLPITGKPLNRDAYKVLYIKE